jgi:hypothetical protein
MTLTISIETFGKTGKQMFKLTDAIHELCKEHGFEVVAMATEGY